MDPSRIRLEDDRFGLIGAAFRPGNRAVYSGRRGDDHVWAIGIIVGPEDDIQTVEIDDRGAKSSRMLSGGELFEGLDILAAPGTEAYIIAGTFTLMGMELGAVDQGATRDFADILRAAADDHSWRLPLRVVGHPRDLQLSAQGRDILRETAATLERDGSATTSLAAARRLELSEHALDSIRRRISRTSLQAYRMHGRWYVVLDNLARSRATPSSVEEAPEAAEAPAAAEVTTEPVVAEAAPQTEPGSAPTEDDLAAFAEPEVAEPEAPAAAEVSEPEPPTEPSVEYVEEQPAEEAETVLDLAASAMTEESEIEFEAAAPAAGETPEPAVEEAADFEELAAEPIWEEPVLAEVEDSSDAEPDVEDAAEYRAAATTPAPTTPLTEEFPTAGAETSELPTEASVEDLAAAAAADEVEATEETISEPEPFAEPAREEEAESPAEVAAEPEAEAAPESEFETETEEAAPETEALGVETAAGIGEPVVAEDLSAIEQMIAEEPTVEAEESAEDELPSEELVPEPAEEPEAAEPEAVVEPEAFSEEHAEDALLSEAEAEVVTEQPTDADVEIVSESEAIITEVASPLETTAPTDELITMAGAAGEEPETVAEAEPEAVPEADIAEPVQSEEALLFAEMVDQSTEDEPAATELEADLAEQSDQLIAERIGDVAEAASESEEQAAEAEAVEEPSDEVIAEGIRSHVPAYGDEVGRDELIDSVPTAEASTEPAEPEASEVSDEQAAPEATEAEAEVPQDEAEQAGGPSAASYFADARSGSGARQATPPPVHAPEIDLATHLRGEVAYLRQQSREKDRQIGVWGDGAKWLQPFVDQIRSLEKQVERLGELQVQRENERISDLISERDALRKRLEALEAKIGAAQTTSAPAEPNRRSWFRRMMGSE